MEFLLVLFSNNRCILTKYSPNFLNRQTKAANLSIRRIFHTHFRLHFAV